MDKPVVIVKNRFMKVNMGILNNVVGCLEKNTSKVEVSGVSSDNLYKFNFMTIENYYRAVNHDMKRRIKRMRRKEF